MIKVTTWKNGNAINASYGIRIKKKDYLRLVNWKTIKVEENYIERNNRPFTEKCPEIRNKFIKDYLEVNNLSQWIPRKPHTLFLFEYEENQFELFLEKKQ